MALVGVALADLSDDEARGTLFLTNVSNYVYSRLPRLTDDDNERVRTYADQRHTSNSVRGWHETFETTRILD